MERKLNKSNLYNLRLQLNQTVMQWPLVNQRVGETDYVELPSEYQLLVYNSLTVDGSIEMDGDIVIL